MVQLSNFQSFYAQFPRKINSRCQATKYFLSFVDQVKTQYRGRPKTPLSSRLFSFNNEVGVRTLIELTNHLLYSDCGHAFRNHSLLQSTAPSAPEYNGLKVLAGENSPKSPGKPTERLIESTRSG